MAPRRSAVRADVADDADEVEGVAEETPAVDESDDVEPPQPPPEPKPRLEERKDAKEKVPAGSPEMRKLRFEEDASLKQIIEQLGADGSFRIKVARLEPEEWEDPRSGKRVRTAGTIRTYTRSIDEELLSDKHGGGKYQLTFTRRNTQGSYVYVTQRTIDIAGDPRIDDIPRTQSVPGAAALGGESPGMVKEAFSVLRDELNRKSDRPPEGINPAIQMMFEQMREDRKRDAEVLAELRRDLAEARNQKPTADPIKEQLIGNLITSKSGEVEALRLRQESELRQAKDTANEDLKRAHDRFDRERDAQTRAHDREITAIRQSHEIVVATTTQSHNLQVKLLESDKQRLERDNEDLRREVKDLREKKDKPLLDQVKDIALLKEQLSDGGGDESTFDKLTNALPAVMEAAQGFLAQRTTKEPAAAARPVLPTVNRVVRVPATGARFIQKPNGDLVPAHRKPAVIQPIVNEDGTQTEPPAVDPAVIPPLVSYLERAFQGKQEPEVVAQSSRSMVPDGILTWIRDHHTDQVSGIDALMSKVVKLPGTSPLSTQAGRNWLRKLGAALVG